MSYRSQYLADIGLAANPYPVNPVDRIQKIYKTARHGGLSPILAMDIWKLHLQPIYVSLSALAATQPAYDDFIVNKSLDIEVMLTAMGRGGLGIAQKIVNLFMKDMWAFSILPAGIEQSLHMPIDAGVLSRLRVIPPTWNPWTKAVARGIKSDTVADYLDIQSKFRLYLAESAWLGLHPPIFASVIEMDQFLWHKI